MCKFVFFFYHYFYFGSLNIPLVGQLLPRPWASNLFMAKGHTDCCGLVCGLSMEKVTINGTLDHVNYCVIFMVYT
jgi:hypothetical protein